MNKSARKNTVAILGCQLGDEGKGRIVDNKLQQMLNSPDVKKVYVIRSQGGNNAGHTVEINDVRIGLHQLPSGIFYKKTVEILDSGMVLNVGDLLAEIELAEKVAGKLSDRIIVSEDALLNTDLQRAKEILNRKLSGKAKGGTGRGIGPTTAEFYDKTGLFVKDLISKDWEKTLLNKYQQFKKLFQAYNESLKDTIVPDFKATKELGKEVTRTVGTSKQFIRRLGEDREKLLALKIVKDTFHLHTKIYNDNSAGVMFEMAQAVGLDPWFGTRPDRTTTPTTIFGISYGTRFWKAEDIEEVIGVMKATYMSSVGARTMPTEIDTKWAHWVRETAHEYGTTTGRPRDICHIDLAFLKYNIRMSGINQMALTHLDISQKNEPIKVCTHYTIDDKKVEYKPDMSFFSKVTPVYKKLKSWNISDVEGTKTVNELPKEAHDYIKFLENEINVPIKYATTGPKRDSLIVL